MHTTTQESNSPSQWSFFAYTILSKGWGMSFHPSVYHVYWCFLGGYIIELLV